MSYTQSIIERNDQQLSMEDAIFLVHANAHQEWKVEAEQVVRHLCSTKQFFTADDVLERITSHTTDNRALGAVMQNAAKAGLIRSTGRYEQSRLPIRHKRPVCLWESVVLRSEPPTN